MANPVFGSLTPSDSSGDRSNSTVNATHDVGSGSNRTVVCAIRVFAAQNEPPNPTDVTYNSVSLTLREVQAYNFVTTRWLKVWIYSLDNPASGSNTGAVQYGSVSGGHAADSIDWFHYTGANNGVGVNTGKATGSSDNPTVTFTTVDTDSLAVGSIAFRGGDASGWTADSPCTERSDRTTGSDANNDISITSIDRDASPGSDAIGATNDDTITDAWAIVAFELNAAAAAGTNVNESDTVTVTDTPDLDVPVEAVRTYSDLSKWRQGVKIVG